jgi:hypothetical protein
MAVAPRQSLREAQARQQYLIALDGAALLGKFHPLVHGEDQGVDLQAGEGVFRRSKRATTALRGMDEAYCPSTS